ncbi:hypothetical protein ACCAA_510071 [Candidatus Accumulibacter aalborgensis]|uniref:Uncharacterized protein n=1 Tax=Candidatus Accumulibacter aalborgensis TaxID=1860102 RepID=A0A1A8XSG6_9PROT|nr:hypothetical protein ACCAA_510071 [Candidatus Accumulibacter aalborgensis]
MSHTCLTRSAGAPTRERGDLAHCGRVVPRRIPQATHLNGLGAENTGGRYIAGSCALIR